MDSPDFDTIFAPASGPAPGPICVIRLSGPATMKALLALTNRRQWLPGKAVLSDFHHPDHAQKRLDRGFGLWFPGPRSYTGEDMAELHIHGGRAVVAALCDALDAVEGLRMAEPGEFTRRAFENGKMDLTEIEAVADLIAAETESQRRQAERQLAGDLGRQCHAWRQNLIEYIAFCEAEIDFSDQDLPPHLLDQQKQDVSRLRGEILTILNAGHGAEHLRNGYEIIFIGPPNIGKSTLFNALMQQELAIVADNPGTTRDMIEGSLNLAGLPLVCIDSAGLHFDKITYSEEKPLSGEALSGDPIEAEGIKRAYDRLYRSDLVLLLTAPGHEAVRYDTLSLSSVPTMVIVAKSDRLSGPDQGQYLAERVKRETGLAEDTPFLCVSAHQGTGLDGLREYLGRYFRQQSEAILSGPPALTRSRHRKELTSVVQALDQALRQDILELRVEDMRIAAYHLGRITGKVDVEDILGAIFENFCIGK